MRLGEVMTTHELIALILSCTAILFTALRDFIIPLFFRPKIFIRVNNDDCVEETEGVIMRNVGPVYSPKSRWLHLKISNKKGIYNKSAKNCRVKLFEILDSSGKNLNPSPFLLKWGVYENYKNDLAPGEYHYVDLVSENINIRNLLLQGPLPKRTGDKLVPGEYTFKVGVFGDNFSPLFKNFKIEFTENFGELKFIK